MNFRKDLKESIADGDYLLVGIILFATALWALVWIPLWLLGRAVAKVHSR